MFFNKNYQTTRFLHSHTVDTIFKVSKNTCAYYSSRPIVNRTNNHHNWLYLLTALVLLMQSFAIWHDSSHPFHIDPDQCQRFESVSHSPTIEPVNTLLTTVISQRFIIKLIAVISPTSVPLHNQHAIRVPPYFS